MSGGEKKNAIDLMLSGTADISDMKRYGYTNEKHFYQSLIKFNTENYYFIVIDNLNKENHNFNETVYKIRAVIKNKKNKKN